MPDKSFRDYFTFISNNRRVYFHFNRQLLIGELAGFGAGVGVAEAAAAITTDEFVISVSSSIADYAGSIIGFLAVFYYDNMRQYADLPRREQFKKIIKNAFSLWPSVAVADVAIIVTRPYVHYLLLISGFEAGVAATIAHFVAVGVFNGIAILSRSILDYTLRKRH